ncbi:hypothetical protein Deipe_4395 (plasmid) [Deinococcus peraridilitoris DSM 19664]|uniref:PRC-barrel domain-containing protein n=2 Tax=Deinococcus TaxID=1298 RepID=L0A9K3_DEIPD|nr:hypothetical protein Deipe_4395 [Deinococcus peraridilitoris DSM 19664]
MPRLRATTLIGLPVTCPDGTCLGQVTQVFFNPATTAVMILQLTGEHHEQLVLPFEAIYELSPAAVVVTSADDPAPVSAFPQAAALVAQQRPFQEIEVHIKGVSACTRIRDVEFDANSGEVLSYEVAAVATSGERFMVVPASSVRLNGNNADIYGDVAALLNDVLFLKPDTWQAHDDVP